MQSFLPLPPTAFSSLICVLMLSETSILVVLVWGYGRQLAHRHPFEIFLAGLELLCGVALFLLIFALAFAEVLGLITG